MEDSVAGCDDLALEATDCDRFECGIVCQVECDVK